MAAAMAGRRAGNLPAEVTSFVGRRRQLAEARGLLSAARMLTLTGVGGVGKTRLALQVAAGLRPEFPDGVWLVDLAPVVAGESVPQEVAQALGMETHTGRPALGEYLKAKRLLLVLDNCEHIVDDCADLAGELLAAAPGLRILATSRQRLHVRGEMTLEVPPLSVPDTDDLAPGDAVARFEAVGLFAERAGAVLPGFTVDDANAAAVLRLCRRLDGIPLAVELAAVRMRALSVWQLLDRLDDRFRILTGGSPAAVRRQQTLRATIDWSYDLCTPDERALWERLSVFSGGFTLDAAVAVCPGDGIDAERIPGALAGLVDKSIVSQEERGEKEYGSRYRMLETIREYGRERLAESGRERALLLRHRDWCRELAAQAEAGWFGPRQMEWAARIRDEQANVCAALEFCLREPGEARRAQEIAASLWCHRLSWTSPRDGHHWLARALRLDTTPTSTRAKALWVEAWLLLLRGDPAEARTLLEECRLLAEKLGDKQQLIGAIHITGLAALLAGDHRRAAALLEEALAYRRASGEEGHVFTALFQLSMAAVFGRDPRAEELCRACVEMCERRDARWSLSYALWIAGIERWWRGDAEAGRAMVEEALRLKLPCNDHLGVAQCVEVLAWLAADAGQSRRGAELLGAAHAVWRSIGTSLAGLGHLAAPHDRWAARLQRELGDRGFAAAYLRGSRLTVDRVVALALGEAVADEAGSTGGGPETVLTRREREIAELVAQGLSNKQIARTLVIAQRTAEGHVERILRKLGFTSRAQIAAAWLARQKAGAGDDARSHRDEADRRAGAARDVPRRRGR